jgi:hypothetical protein
MPENKLENFIFTILMAFIMVYAMICYNIALNLKGMTDQVFLMAFGEMRIMWPVAIVLELFVMEKPVMYLTKRVIHKDTFFPMILLVRCSLTVCLMCPAMSLVATLLFKDFHTVGLISTFIETAVLNFPMALGWQIFFGGPFGRLIFRTFKNLSKNRKVSTESAKEML